jgi:hypothetical protein
MRTNDTLNIITFLHTSSLLQIDNVYFHDLAPLYPHLHDYRHHSATLIPLNRYRDPQLHEILKVEKINSQVRNTYYLQPEPQSEYGDPGS